MKTNYFDYKLPQKITEKLKSVQIGRRARRYQRGDQNP